IFWVAGPQPSLSQNVRSWSTTLSLEHKLSEQVPLEFGPALDLGAAKITVDDTKAYQHILGMGSSFDHSTCSNLSKLNSKDREAVLRSLLDPSPGIGLNLMRICIGTSDFTGDPWYSYDDMPSGKTDSELSHFSIAKDRVY